MPTAQSSYSAANEIAAGKIDKPSAPSAGQVLAYDGSTWIAAASGSQLTSGTVVTLAGQTSVDFTGIPSTAKRIIVMLNAVSTTGTNNYLIQLGSSTFETTGYVSYGILATNASANTITTNTNGFHIISNNMANSMIGNMILTNPSGNMWNATATHVNNNGTGSIQISGGSKTLAGSLDRIRLTTVSPDTFDAGTVNIMWE
jgi:hypothetical protein